MRLLALARKKPVERMISSSSAGAACGERGGVGIAREEPGRDHVDALVRALRREDRGDGELEGVAVVERAARLGVRLLEQCRGSRAANAGRRPERRQRGGTGVILPARDLTARGGRLAWPVKSGSLRALRGRAARGGPRSPRTASAGSRSGSASSRTASAMRSSSSVAAVKLVARRALSFARRTSTAIAGGGEAERPQPARRAAGQRLGDLGERERIALAVADRCFLLEEGGRRRDRDLRLALAARRRAHVLGGEAPRPPPRVRPRRPRRARRASRSPRARAPTRDAAAGSRSEIGFVATNERS